MKNLICIVVMLILAGAVVYLYLQNQKLVCESKKSVNLKQIVMTVDLKDDPKIIDEYKTHHSPQGVWPEVTNAAQVSGYESIQIYNFDNRLVMVLRYPENADKAKIDSLYASSSEKMSEWATIMNCYMSTIKGAPEGSLWVAMQPIYNYEREHK